MSRRRSSRSSGVRGAVAVVVAVAVEVVVDDAVVVLVVLGALPAAKKSSTSIRSPILAFPVTSIPSTILSFLASPHPHLDRGQHSKLLFGDVSKHCDLSKRWIHLKRCGLGGAFSVWKLEWFARITSQTKANIVTWNDTIPSRKVVEYFLESMAIVWSCHTWHSPQFIQQWKGILSAAMRESPQELGSFVMKLGTNTWE